MAVIYSLVIFYVAFLLLSIIFWITYSSYKNEANDRFVSVLIAARNEEPHLPALFKSLEAQEYPLEKLEIILIDDHSTDSSFRLMTDFQKKSRWPVICLQTNIETMTPKKEALNLGVQHAKGELYLFTDADCTMRKDWVSEMVSPFGNPSVGLTFGPIHYEDGGFLEKMLSAEQAALLGSSLATLKMSVPTMCNGANMAVRKTSFERVRGLETDKLSASGDDELLLHKLFKEDKNSIHFVKKKSAIVSTACAKDWSSLFKQRKRWAGKWEKYLLLRTKLFALFIFSFHLVWMCLVLLLISKDTSSFAWTLVVCKLFLETVFIAVVMDFLGKKINLLAFCALQLLYSPYVVFFGLVSRNQKFEWKGRVLK